MATEYEGLETVSSFLDKHQELRDDIVSLWHIEKILSNVQLRYLYLASLISSDSIYNFETAEKAMEKITFLKRNLHYLDLDDDVLKEAKTYINKGIRIIKKELKEYRQDEVRD
jgi:hypothetical protein